MTAIFFFSLIAEIENRVVGSPLRLSNYREQAAESGYKLLIYKLWQYSAKNKPYVHNNVAIRFSKNGYAVQRSIPILYQPYAEQEKLAKSHFTRSASIGEEKKPLLGCASSFLEMNMRNISGGCNRGVLGFMLSICEVRCLLARIMHLFQNSGIDCNSRQYFGLKNLTLRISHSIIWRLSEDLQETFSHVSRIFYHGVRCQ
ncbi:hypothetical protein V3565_03925 [Bartonella sp. B10]